MEFSRPEYWSVEPFPSPGDHPNKGVEPGSPALQVDSLPTEPSHGVMVSTLDPESSLERPAHNSPSEAETEVPKLRLLRERP